MSISTSGHEPQAEIVPTALQALAQNGSIDLQEHDLIAVVKPYSEIEPNLEHPLLKELEAHLFAIDGPKLILIFKQPTDFQIEEAVTGVLDVTQRKWSGYDGPIATLTEEWCEALGLTVKKTELSPDLDEAVQFLQMYAEGGPWVLSAIKEAWGNVVPTATFYPSDEDRMRLWITQQQNLEANAYFSAAEPRRALKKKAEKTDIKQSSYVWVDLDLGNGVNWQDTNSVNAELQKLAERINGFSLTPTCIIFTGGGLQVFWRLSEPFELIVENERERFEAINKAISKILDGDKCHNVDRIMRLPGTVNFLSAKKRRLGRTPMLARMIGYDPNLVYTIDSFDWLMDGDRGESEPEASGLSVIDEMQARLKAAPKTVEEWANAVLDPKKYDRSEIRASVAYKAFKEGRTVDEVVELFNGKDIASDKSRKLLTEDIKRLHKKWQTDGGISKSQEEHATDLGNARRFVKRHGENIRFVYDINVWIIWKDNHWHIDKDGEIQRLAKETVVSILEEAVQTTNEDKRKKLVGHALASQKANRIADMLVLARSEIEVVLTPDKLDADPWLLGVKNGVIELKTQTFRVARRKDYITKRANVVYDPNATCEEWEAFLDTIMDGDTEVISYDQRFLGYTLTGSTKSEVMLILWGTGRNGKTTFRETISVLMGDYGMVANASLIMEKRDQSGPEPEVAGLKGKRWVTINETAEGAKLNEARVKSIISTDAITARWLHKNPITFYPTHKLVLTTNHKPIIQGTDEGMWRKIPFVPFNIDLKTKGKIIEDFRDTKLLPELPGILNWALKGLKAYLKEGLNPPKAVLQATQEYREDMNIVHRWAKERTEDVREDTAGTHFESTADLYGDFEQWAKDEMRWVITKRRFSDRLSELGYKDYRTKAERGFIGIKLKNNRPNSLLQLRPQLRKIQ